MGCNEAGGSKCAGGQIRFRRKVESVAAVRTIAYSHSRADPPKWCNVELHQSKFLHCD